MRASLLCVALVAFLPSAESSRNKQRSSGPRPRVHVVRTAAGGYISTSSRLTEFGKKAAKEIAKGLEVPAGRRVHIGRDPLDAKLRRSHPLLHDIVILRTRLYKRGRKADELDITWDGDVGQLKLDDGWVRAQAFSNAFNRSIMVTTEAGECFTACDKAESQAALASRWIGEKLYLSELSIGHGGAVVLLGSAIWAGVTGDVTTVLPAGGATGGGLLAWGRSTGQKRAMARIKQMKTTVDDIRARERANEPLPHIETVYRTYTTGLRELGYSPKPFRKWILDLQWFLDAPAADAGTGSSRE